MKTNKKYITIAALLIATLGGCFSKTEDNSAPKAATRQPLVIEGKVLLDKADKTGDDNGPGTYSYPTDTVFKAKSFDLTNIKITETDTQYNIYVDIGTDFKNDWKMPGGWDIQLFDVYLNLGTGIHKQTISGRNVIITDGWDKAVMISPSGKSLVQSQIMGKNTAVKDGITTAENLAADVLIPDEITIYYNTLIAKISKDKIKDMSGLKSIQVFVLGSEGEPTDSDTLNRVVNNCPAQWRFGGGTDYDGDTNVVDILGDNAKMGEYTSTSKSAIFAKVDMVGK